MYKLITTTFVAALGLTVIQASAEDRRFVLENKSNRTIVQVQTSNIGEAFFHPVDLLDDEVLRPGESIVLEPDNHQGWCRFDVRITFRNGDRQDISDVNMCTITSLATYGNADDGSYYSVNY
jgi:hypothetical protein